MTDKLHDLERLLADAESAYINACDTSQSSNGIAALGRLRLQLTTAVHEERRRLEELERERQDSEMSNAERFDLLVEHLARMPGPQLTELAARLAEAGVADALRRGLPPDLRVVGQ